MSLQGPHVLRGLDGGGGSAFNRLSVKTGCSSDGGGESVIVSTHGQQAAKISLEDVGNVCGVFSAPTYLPLTCAPIWDSVRNSYAALLNKHQLAVWDGQEMRLEKLDGEQMVKLKKPAFDLIQNSKETFVIFEDGSAQTLSYLVTTRDSEEEEDSSGSQVPPDRQIISAEFFEHRGGSYLVTQFRCNDGSTTIETYRARTDPDESMRASLERVNTGDVGRKNLKTLAVLPARSDGGPQVFFLDPEGYLVSRALLGSSSSPGAEKVVVNIGGLVFPDDNIRLVSLDPDFAVACGRDRDDRKGSSRILLISLVFSSVVHSIILDGNRTGKMCSCLGRIFLYSDRQVTMVSAADLPRSLDEMIAGTWCSYEALMIALTEASTVSGKVKSSSTMGSTQVKPSGTSNVKVKLRNEVSRSVELYKALPELFDKQDVKALGEILDNENDIPELLLLSAIEVLFNIPEDQIRKSYGISKNKKEWDAQVTRETLLYKAFNVSFTEPLMLQYLGQTDFETALKMLGFLDLALKLELYDHCHKEDEENLLFPKFVNWVALIMNAHYSNVIITKDVASLELVASLSETVAECERRMAAQATLMPHLKLIQAGKKVSGTSGSASKAYCIELVNF